MMRINHISAIGLDREPQLHALFEFELSPFNFSWNQSSIPHQARYGVFLSSSSLYAAFDCPIVPWISGNDYAGQFVSGLWNYDVGEIFIGCPSLARYQEFNLSPAGSWWSAVFSSYRTVDPAINVETGAVTTWHHLSDAGWRAVISIPFSAIKLPFSSPQDLRCNVCVIQGNSPRHFLSAATIGTSEPDFHHYADYLPLQINATSANT